MGSENTIDLLADRLLEQNREVSFERFNRSKEIAQAVGNFYKELLSQNVPEPAAVQLTIAYLVGG